MKRERVAGAAARDELSLRPPAAGVLRVVTYNIHKCRGLDGRLHPRRIAEVLCRIHPDVAALQEVVSLDGGRSEQDQARFIAEALGFDYRLAEARKYRKAAYGNLLLSRLPISDHRIWDLTWARREPRICQRVTLAARSRPIQIFNVHLGTSYLERRRQAVRLIEALSSDAGQAPRILVGDFNEWIRGLVTRLLCEKLVPADIELHTGRRRTYPGVIPLLHLDHIYHDAQLKLEGVVLVRNRLTMVASDHLPLVADFRLP